MDDRQSGIYCFCPMISSISPLVFTNKTMYNISVYPLCMDTALFFDLEVFHMKLTPPLPKLG